MTVLEEEVSQLIEERVVFLFYPIVHGHCGGCGLQDSPIYQSSYIMVNGIKSEGRIEAL